MGVNLDQGQGSTWIMNGDQPYGDQPLLLMRLNLDYGWGSTCIIDEAQLGLWMGLNLHYRWDPA